MKWFWCDCCKESINLQDGDALICPFCGTELHDGKSDVPEEEINSDTTIELLPCPFCGSKAEYHSKLDVEPVIDSNGAYVDADTFYYEYTGCPNCEIWFYSTDNDDEPEGSTILKWNKRSNASKLLDGDPIDIDKKVEHYEKTLEEMINSDWWGF